MGIFQGNRLTKLENLDTLVDLEELHVDQQEIESFDGIQKLVRLPLLMSESLLSPLPNAGYSSATSSSPPR